MKAGKCWEDNYAYFENDIPNSKSYQPSKSACQQACAEHDGCSYWTWRKGSAMGACYLKTSNAGRRQSDYHNSGTKDCDTSEKKG